MKRKSLTTLMAAAALGMSTGCASFNRGSSWSNPFAFGRSAPAAEAASEESALARLRNRFTGEPQDGLSPEFRAAQKTLKKNPEKSLLSWARYQEDIGDYAEARKMYRELEIAYPENMEAHLGMARIELLTGRSQQAEQILTSLMKESPGNVEVRLAIGRLYSQQEKWDESILAFEEACELEPDNQNCHYELGVACARAGKFDQALSHLTYSVGEPAAHYNIGYILHEEGKDVDAVEWFQNALELHPDKQTSEKSRAMLAKLGPSSNGALPDSIRIAQRPASTPRNLIPSGTPVDSQAGRAQGMMLQASSAASYVPSGEQLPYVSSGRQHSVPEMQVARRAENFPDPSSDAPEKSPFRNVSYSDSPTPSALPPVGEPPQWRGPSPQASPPAGDQWAAPKDPPNWRARKN